MCGGEKNKSADQKKNRYAIPWGSPLSNPYFRTKTTFLKTDSLADTFFWTKNFQKNVKCYGEKVLEFFLTLKKKIFFRTLVFKKISKKIWKIF